MQQDNELIIGTLEKNLELMESLSQQSRQLLTVVMGSFKDQTWENIFTRASSRDITFDLGQFSGLLRRVETKLKLRPTTFMPLVYYLFAEETGVEPRAILPDETRPIYERTIMAGFDREIYNITSRLLDMSKTEVKDRLATVDVRRFKKEAYVATLGQIQLCPRFKNPPKLEKAA